MTPAKECLICAGPIEHVKYARVSPFLEERIWGEPSHIDSFVSVVRCDSCNFTFYDRRLTSDEEARLYAGYRGEEYQKQRQKHEPNYTAEFNAHFESAEEYGQRRDTVRRVLARHLDFSRIKIILDFGGGRGELCVGLIPNAEVWVYDVSGREPVPGAWITHVPYIPDMNLLVASNLLEHAGSPRQLLGQIREATPLGSYTFFEVPQETVAPAMHEHVSYFSEKALRKLVEQHFTVTASGIDGAIWCLAKAQ